VRMLCCSTYLGYFESVSIKMAKDQKLLLNTTKISGLCGRIMCCIKYENDTCEKAKRQLPDIGQKIETSYGKGRVTGINILDKVVHIEIENNGNQIEYTLDEMIEQKIIEVTL